MSKTIIIKGKPCSGKSWLIRKLKNILEINQPHTFIGPISGTKYNYYSNGNLYIIGRYDDNVYGGLDAFHPKGEVVDLIHLIESENPNAIIYCEGCITKVYPYDEKIYLQVDDDVLVKNLKARREQAMLKRKNLKPFTEEEIAHKLDIFIRHDKAAINKKYNIMPHNTDEQRQYNLEYIINLSKT